MARKTERGDRAYEARGRTRTIMLTRGLWAVVDEADYHMVCLHRWQAFSSRSGYHARRQYRVPGTDRKATVTLSHVIMGARLDQAVRHLNGNTLDCTRANMVLVQRRGVMPIDPNTGRRLTKPEASPLQDPLDEEYQA